RLQGDWSSDVCSSDLDIQFDWTSYDARLGKYLDGSAFTEKYGYSGPGYGVPTELLILPFDAYPTNDYYNSRHVGWPYGKEWKFRSEERRVGKGWGWGR